MAKDDWGDVPAPANEKRVGVYGAICAVQADLSKHGISKDSENKFDGYKFRGIDAVYNALSPLLAKHGLCILPRIISRVSEERISRKGDPVFYVTVEAEFDFVCADDGSKHVVKTFGEAMDRGDKATNKAMSAAYKYAAFQAFAIPTEGDNDADAQSHDVKPKSIAADEWGSLDEDTQKWMLDEAMAISVMLKDGDIEGAYKHLESLQLDDTYKTAFWSRLDATQRSTIKAYTSLLHAKSLPALVKAWGAVPKHSQTALEVFKDKRKAELTTAEVAFGG